MASLGVNTMHHDDTEPWTMAATVMHGLTIAYSVVMNLWQLGFNKSAVAQWLRGCHGDLLSSALPRIEPRDEYFEN